MALWNLNCLLQCGRRHRLCFYQKYFDSCEWWYLNYKCFSISFDDEDIYGDNGNAFDDDGDNDNEDAFLTQFLWPWTLLTWLQVSSQTTICALTQPFL